MKKYTTIVMLMVAYVMVIAVNIGGTDAKRGCASFGHACYGGMGKRNDDLLNTNEELLLEEDIDRQQQDENPQFVFTGPRNGIGGINNQLRRPLTSSSSSSSSSLSLPSSSSSSSTSLSANDILLREQLLHLSPFLRQWLRSYRNAEQLNTRK